MVFNGPAFHYTSKTCLKRVWLKWWCVQRRAKISSSYVENVSYCCTSGIFLQKTCCVSQSSTIQRNTHILMHSSVKAWVQLKITQRFASAKANFQTFRLDKPTELKSKENGTFVMAARSNQPFVSIKNCMLAHPSRPTKTLGAPIVEGHVRLKIVEFSIASRAAFAVSNSKQACPKGL